MTQTLAHVSLVVKDYDEAIAFYCGILGFQLVEDSALPEPGKRWVLIAPEGNREGTKILLAKASNPEQLSAVGNQTGGRVFLFLATDHFWDDYERYSKAGVHFIRSPANMPYGTVTVFEDLYGNRWDLIQYSNTPA